MCWTRRSLPYTHLPVDWLSHIHINIYMQRSGTASSWPNDPESMMIHDQDDGDSASEDEYDDEDDEQLEEESKFERFVHVLFLSLWHNIHSI